VSAPEVDASNMIIMPASWIRTATPGRTAAQHSANGRLDPDYMRDIGGTARSVYRPQDVHAGDLLTAWVPELRITTLLDWSHISKHAGAFRRRSRP